VAILNPSFEIAEPNANPGEAEDWTHGQSGAIGKRWAGYQAHDTDPVFYAVEQYHGGWGNDGAFIWGFIAGSTVAQSPETFEDWITSGVDMPWETELDPADRFNAFYDIWAGAFPGFAQAEAFESLWDNDRSWITGVPTYDFHLRQFQDGGAPTYTDPGTGLPSYVIGSGDRIRVVLTRWLGMFPSTFAPNMVLTPGTYNVADMVTHLQAVTDAALTAAGGAFAPGDILWTEAPGGGVRVSVDKSLYWMNTTEPTSGVTAWGSLLFTIDPRGTQFHPGDFTDVATLALYTPGLAYELFDLYWDNDFDEVLFDLRDWIDGHDAVYPLTITGGVNDVFWIYWDNLAGQSTMLQCTINPNTYPNAAALAADMQIQITAALIAAPVVPPMGGGEISAIANPTGQIRLINHGSAAPPGYQMWLATPIGVSDAWPDLGYDLQFWLAPGVWDFKTRRLPDFLALTAAMYDVVPGPPEPYENFEDNWTSVLP